MKHTLTLALVAILVSAVGAAQVPPRYSDWADGPVRHLMTRDEARRWKAVRSEPEAEAFIALFWARRDPTPATARNEFQEEFNRRVEVADRYFSSAKLRGALSDPGKVLILLGPPYQISRSGSGSPELDALGRPIVNSINGVLPRQIWTYAHDHKPRFITEDRIILAFVDEGEGTNEWQLGYTDKTNPDMVLQRAVTALIVSPNLTKPPVFAAPPRVKEFRDAGLGAAFDRFRKGEEASPAAAQLTWGEFLSSEGALRVDAQLYLSAGSGLAAGQKVTLFAVVEDSKGEIVQVEERPTSLLATGSDAYVDCALQLDPGSYHATFGLAGVDGSIVTATDVPITVTPIDRAASGISPLLLSSNVYALQVEAGPYDPFTFGALKVVPKGDLMFVPKGDLWYFAEVRNPGLTVQGIPAISVQVDVEGKTRKGPVALHLPLAPAETPLLKGTADRYAVGQALPLEGFSPGEYTIRVRIVDTVREKTWELAKTFFVRGL